MSANREIIWSMCYPIGVIADYYLSNRYDKALSEAKALQEHLRCEPVLNSTVVRELFEVEQHLLGYQSKPAGTMAYLWVADLARSKRAMYAPNLISYCLEQFIKEVEVLNERGD